MLSFPSYFLDQTYFSILGKRSRDPEAADRTRQKKNSIPKFIKFSLMHSFVGVLNKPQNNPEFQTSE